MGNLLLGSRGMAGVLQTISWQDAAIVKRRSQVCVLPLAQLCVSFFSTFFIKRFVDMMTVIDMHVGYQGTGSSKKLKIKTVQTQTSRKNRVVTLSLSNFGRKLVCSV